MIRTNLANSLQLLPLREKETGICFLGQAGFVIKLSTGRLVMIDPYFSDVCEKRLGPAFKRLTPPLLQPEDVVELGIDAYLITHHHEDHLDPDGITRMGRGHFPFYAPPSSIDILHDIGVERERCFALALGQSVAIGDMKIHAVFADHGELAPDAVGYVIETDGATIYHMGDTCMNADEFRRIGERFHIDIAIVPINGKYGNMNEEEAARAVAILKAKTAIPCHFWMLPGNSGGNVAAFLERCKDSMSKANAMLLAQGEIYICSYEGRGSEC